MVYAHGLGHASSIDGINWVKDTDNPIFIYNDGVPWRNTRTYTPFVLFEPFCSQGSCSLCNAKMWFGGGTGIMVPPGPVAGVDQGIGYATLPCPPLPAPLPPTNFVGKILKNRFLNRTECILKAEWDASTSINVIYYRIYKNGKVVAKVSAKDPLLYETCLHHCKAKGYEITSVNSDNLESVHVKLEVISSSPSE